MKQNINFWLIEEKVQDYIILMILKLFLNTQMIWVMFIKTLKNTTPNKKPKIWIIFDYMIADMLSNKNLNPIVTELFIRGTKLNISHVFIIQSYFAVPKNIRLNSMNYFIIKIPNKGELSKLNLIIYQMLTLKTLWIFTKYVLQNQILF